MTILEDIALEAGMETIMLTVFAENTAALSFYKVRCRRCRKIGRVNNSVVLVYHKSRPRCSSSPTAHHQRVICMKFSPSP